MAGKDVKESKEPKEDKKDEAESPRKGGILKLIILGAVLLALLAGGIFGWRWWSAKRAAKRAAEAAAKAAVQPQAEGDSDSADDEEDEPAPASGEGHGGGATGPVVLVLKPIVNLESQRKNAFLKCELHILFRDPELGKLATGDKPTVENSTIRAMVLESLSGKSVEEASDPETRDAVRKELKKKLNERFKAKHKASDKDDPTLKPPKKPIRDVLVVDWAIAQ